MVAEKVVAERAAANRVEADKAEASWAAEREMTILSCLPKLRVL